MKKISLLFLITFTVILGSCEKSLYEDSLKQDAKNIFIKNVSIDEIDFNISSKIKEEINFIKSFKKNINNQSAKFAYDEVLGVYIDTDNGKLISYEGKIFYTFPMFSKSEDKLENILFLPKDNGELESYFVKYNVDPKEFDQLSDEEIKNLTPQYSTLTTAGEVYVCIDVIFTYTIYSGCSEDHPNGETCSNQTQTYISTFCNWTGSPSGPGNGSNPGSSNGNGSNITVGGSNSSVNGTTITTPINLTPTQINLKELIKRLDADQLEWWNEDASDETKAEISEHINQNEDNFEELVFVDNLIDATVEYLELYGDTDVNHFFIENFFQNLFNDESIDITDVEILAPDCESFNFVSTGNNWQMAAVSNIRFQVTVLTPQGAYINHIIDFPQPMLFESPKNLSVGNTTITPGIGSFCICNGVNGFNKRNC